MAVVRLAQNGYSGHCNRRVLDIDNYLEEVTNMTRKALLIFASVVVAVLFSFTTFAQEQGQEVATKSSEKTITVSSLQTQIEKIEGLKTRYAQVKAEYDEECTGKSYKSIEDYQKNYQKKCTEKLTQVTNSYNELKKEIEAYNKNREQYKANSAKKSTDATGSSAQGKGN